MNTGTLFDRHFRRQSLHIDCFRSAPADLRQLIRPEKQFFNKAVMRIILDVLQDCQDLFQITERIQVIRLCCFRYAVDDCTGFRTINAVDQLPCMFVQAEAMERSFCYVIIKRNFTIIQEPFQFLFFVQGQLKPPSSSLL